MHYQYVRFNIYPLQDAPDEKELWLELDSHYNDAALKDFLGGKYAADVTLIKSVVITANQYVSNYAIR